MPSLKWCRGYFFKSSPSNPQTRYVDADVVHENMLASWLKKCHELAHVSSNIAESIDSVRTCAGKGGIKYIVTWHKCERPKYRPLRLRLKTEKVFQHPQTRLWFFKNLGLVGKRPTHAFTIQIRKNGTVGLEIRRLSLCYVANTRDNTQVIQILKIHGLFL